MGRKKSCYKKLNAASAEGRKRILEIRANKINSSHLSSILYKDQALTAAVESDDVSSDKEELDDQKTPLSKAQNLSIKYARLQKENNQKRKSEARKSWMDNLEKANNAKKKPNIAKGKVQKKPKQNPKLWKDLTREERCRRRKVIERIAPGARVTSSPVRESLDAEASLALVVREGLTVKQAVGIRKTLNGAVASKYSINKQRKKILSEYCSQVDVQTSSIIPVKTYTFDDTFLFLLRQIGLENLPSNPTVVFSDDFGGETFKGGWYLADRETPCSDEKFILIFSIEDKENYEICQAVLKKSIESLPKWKQGCFVDNFFIKVKCIKTGDLKDINMYNGLQGCQATCFCPVCIIKKSELILRKRDSPYRTLAQLYNDFEKLQQLIEEATTARAKAAAHQHCHSVKNPPATDHFEPSHIAPGIMHVLAGSTNAIVDWAKKSNKEKIDKLFKDAAVYPQGHTKKLTGNHGRILLNKLANNDVYYDGSGADLLYLLADIQQYAVAKVLTQEEIDELNECIEAFVEEFKKPEYDEIAKSCQYIHMLIAHVMPFVIQHKSWGLFSDQPGEAIHKTQQRFFKKIPKRSNNPNSSNKAVNPNQYFVDQSVLRNRFSS